MRGWTVLWYAIIGVALVGIGFNLGLFATRHKAASLLNQSLRVNRSLSLNFSELQKAADELLLANAKLMAADERLKQADDSLRLACFGTLARDGRKP